MECFREKGSLSLSLSLSFARSRARCTPIRKTLQWQMGGLLKLVAAATEMKTTTTQPPETHLTANHALHPLQDQPTTMSCNPCMFKSRRSCTVLVCSIVLLAVSYAALASAPFTHFFSAPFQLPPRLRTFFDGILQDQQQQHETRVEDILKKGAMANSKTVIITTLNAAWAKEGTMIDIFLDSFRHGHETQPLLQNMVIVCVDSIAYKRCLHIHPHCLFIKTPGVDFSGEQLLLSTDYIKLMWRRIKFLQTVLKLNYSFVFTDTDVLWIRNPFPQLETDTQADFQIACDQYNGKPFDVNNRPNAGFTYVRSNEKTIKFYEYWYEQRIRGARMADQEVLNAIKFDNSFTSIGLKMRFLDTRYFGGFCALRSTDMTKAITMHANCCKGLEAKVIDLRAILERWKKWQMVNNASTTLVPPRDDASSLHNTSIPPLSPQIPVPLACPLSWHKH